MSTYYYRYLDLDLAEDYLAKDGHVVWYYEKGQTDPPRCKTKADRPAGAVAAVVASPDARFAAGEAMGVLDWTGDKDPLPPPPPPPWQYSLTYYLTKTEAGTFFASQPRSTDA